jgi:HSP20 family protein
MGGLVVMEIDNLKKWLEVAQHFQSDRFWNQIFDENSNSQSAHNLTLNPLTAAKEYFPKCDLFEIENELIVEAEIPGMKREDLHISIQQQFLTISGEFNSLQSNRKYFLKERANRKFKKELILPYAVLINKTHTEIRNGILVIVMPINRTKVENIPIAFEQSSQE